MNDAQNVQDLVAAVPWTFIVTICNLLITMWAVKKWLFKPIREIVAKRKAMADSVIEEANKAREEAYAMKADYEQSIKDAHDEASNIISTAQKTATQQSEEILREATSSAARMKEKAEADIQQERRKAVNELKDEIGSMAMEIAGKVIEREIREEDHTKLIDEFIENVGEKS